VAITEIRNLTQRPITFTIVPGQIAQGSEKEKGAVKLTLGPVSTRDPNVSARPDEPHRVKLAAWSQEHGLKPEDVLAALDKSRAFKAARDGISGVHGFSVDRAPQIAVA